MGKKLGTVANPEQYLKVPKRISPLDNSVKAWKYLVSSGCSEDIIVYPAEIHITSPIYPCLIHWMAFDEKEKKIVAIVPCCDLDADLIAGCDITAIELITKDCFFVWDHCFYSVVFTSTGESVIKKVNGIWCESDVISLMQIKAPHLINPNIYPVELFSTKLGKFVCAVWAVEDVEQEVVYWYPVQWNDHQLLDDYDSNDLQMIPLNVGDITRAGDIVFKICYAKELGVYFEKTNEALNWRHFFTKEKPDEVSIGDKSIENTLLLQRKSQNDSAPKKKHDTLIIPLRPKKN